MHLRLAILCLAAVATFACDRGASLHKEGAAAEKQGNIEDARQTYLGVTQRFPTSDTVPLAKHDFVRLSLDLAEKATAEGDIQQADRLLGEAQPQMEEVADRERFQKVKTALREAGLAAREIGDVRALFEHLSTVAAQAKATPDAAKQPGDLWSDAILPDMPKAMQYRMRLGKDGSVERTGFMLAKTTRVGSGQFVAAIETATTKGPQQDEWYVQNTTNGWRVLCVQAQGGTDCKDPWAYKKIDIK